MGKIKIIKTHAKNANGLYKSGEVYEDKDVEALQFKLDTGLVKRVKASVKEEKKVLKTKEEKKTRKTK